MEEDIIFFKSDKVKIFPCSRRINTYDPESRFTTERNLTSLGGWAFDRDSYVIEAGTASNGYLWRLIIKGYYFEIQDTSTKPQITSQHWFAIGLESTSGVPSRRLGRLNTITYDTGTSPQLYVDSVDSGDLDVTIVGDTEPTCFAICLCTEDTVCGYGIYRLKATETLGSISGSYASDAELQSEASTRLANDSALSDRIQTNANNIQTNADRINSLKTDLQKYAEDEADAAETAAKSYADSQDVTLRTAIEGGEISGDTTAKTIKGAKEYADNLNKVIAERVSSLEAADTAFTSRVDAIYKVDGTSTTGVLAEEITRAALAEAALDSRIEGVISAYGDADAQVKTEVKTEVIGKSGDTETTDTIYGAKAYADSQDSVLKTVIEGTSEDTSNAATIAGAKKYAAELVANLTGQGGGTGAPESLAAETAERIEEDGKLDAKITALSKEIGNLTNVMNFRGAVTSFDTITDPVEGDVITFSAEVKDGDEVVVKAGSEWVYSGNIWVEIGTASASDAAIADLKSRMAAAEGDIDQAQSDISAIGANKLDKTTYEDYIAGKSMSDEALKGYADDVAGTAKSEAITKAEQLDSELEAKLIGSDTDIADAETIKGAKAYAKTIIGSDGDGKDTLTLNGIKKYTTETVKEITLKQDNSNPLALVFTNPIASVDGNNLTWNSISLTDAIVNLIYEKLVVSVNPRYSTNIDLYYALEVEDGTGHSVLWRQDNLSGLGLYKLPTGLNVNSVDLIAPEGYTPVWRRAEQNEHGEISYTAEYECGTILDFSNNDLPSEDNLMLELWLFDGKERSRFKVGTIQEVLSQATCIHEGSHLCTYTWREQELIKETIVDSPTGVHTEGTVVVKNEVAADCTNDGSYDNVVYCSVCGDELRRETVVVDAKGHSFIKGICEHCEATDPNYTPGTDTPGTDTPGIEPEPDNSGETSNTDEPSTEPGTESE